MPSSPPDRAESERGATHFVGLAANRGFARVTAQDGAYGRLRDKLAELSRIARARGASFTWTIQKMRQRIEDNYGC